MPDPVVGRLSVILIDEIPISDAKAIASLIEKVAGVVEVRYEVKAAVAFSVCSACDGTGWDPGGYPSDRRACPTCGGIGTSDG